METRNVVRAVIGLGMVLLFGCAASTGQRGREIIPPGKGHLILETGGIEHLNFAVFDQATGQKVADIYGWKTYLDPGMYRIVVKTDLHDEVDLDDVNIVEGQETHTMVPIGRFMVTVLGDQGTDRSRAGRLQIPFAIYDYRMKTVLGRGMTSVQVEQLIAPEGVYKIRLTPRTGGGEGGGQERLHDIIRPIQVQFGRVYPLTIDLRSTAPSTGEEGGGGGGAAPR